MILAFQVILALFLASSLLVLSYLGAKYYASDGVGPHNIVSVRKLFLVSICTLIISLALLISTFIFN